MKHIARRLLLLFVMLLPAQAWAVLEIRITGGTEGALPIAVVPFAWQGAGPAPLAVHEVVTSDLARSGKFSPLPRKDMLEQPHHAQDVSFANWRAVGVENLVVGRIRPAGANNYVIQFQLLDVFKAGQVTGHSITVPAGQLRNAAHAVSDIIYEAILGERGAFNTRIAFVTQERLGDGEARYKLQIADTDGHNPQTIVVSEEPIMSPSWSPDMRQLAYVSFERKRAQIYVQDLATGKRTVLSDAPGINGAPSWSPDGTRLALTLSRDGNPELYVLDLNSRKLRRLTRSRAIDTEPAWSADGRSLFFTSDRSGQPQIYRIDLDGGAARRVTFEGRYNAKPVVAPDGRTLAMVHEEQGNYRIAAIDLETGALRVLTEGRLDESPSFAPNGSMILYATETQGRAVLAAVSTDGRTSQQLRLQEGDVREPSWSPFRPE